MLLALIAVAVSCMPIGSTATEGKHFEASGVIMVVPSFVGTNFQQIASCVLYSKVVEINTASALPICLLIGLRGIGESYDFIADKYNQIPVFKNGDSSTACQSGAVGVLWSRVVICKMLGEQLVTLKFYY